MSSNSGNKVNMWKNINHGEAIPCEYAVDSWLAIAGSIICSNTCPAGSCPLLDPALGILAVFSKLFRSLAGAWYEFF